MPIAYIIPSTSPQSNSVIKGTGKWTPSSVPNSALYVGDTKREESLEQWLQNVGLYYLRELEDMYTEQSNCTTIITNNESPYSWQEQ